MKSRWAILTQSLNNLVGLLSIVARYFLFCETHCWKSPESLVLLYEPSVTAAFFFHFFKIWISRPQHVNNVTCRADVILLLSLLSLLLFNGSSRVQDGGRTQYHRSHCKIRLTSNKTSITDSVQWPLPPPSPQTKSPIYTGYITDFFENCRLLMDFFRLTHPRR